MHWAKLLQQHRLPYRLEIIPVIFIVLLAFGLRVAYLQVNALWSQEPQYDGDEYSVLATNMLNGHGFATIPGEPYGFRPPGYPAFVAVLFAAFGHSYFAIRMANVILGTLSCLLIYFFARQVWDWRVAMLASLGMAIHPLFIYFTGMIYPESLMMFLGLLALLVGLFAMQTRRILLMIPLGLLFGLLIYLRPTFLLLGIAHFVIIWVTFATFRHRIAAFAILVVAMISLIIPWSMRNYLVFDRFVLMSTNSGVTLWGGNNPLANGGWIEPGPANWQGADPPVDLRGWPTLSETESDARFQRHALDWIEENPETFLTLLPKKLYRAWSLSIGNEARQVELPAIIRIAYSGFLIVSLLGFWISLRHWREATLLYLPVLIVCLTSMIYYGSTRQSALMIPSLLVLTAVAIVTIFDGTVKLFEQTRVERPSSAGSNLQ